MRIDINDEVEVDRAITRSKPEAVIHAASITDVDLCERNPELALRINAAATRSIAKACSRTNCFLVYVSTDYVFDGRQGCYRENDMPNPINVYGRSKLLGEQETLRCNDRFCIARTSVVYGWGRKYRPNFAAWIYNKLKAHEQVKVVSDQYASPTLNSNLAAMLLETAEQRAGGVIHLAGATRASRYDFALSLADRFGFDRNLVVPAKSGASSWLAKRPPDSSLDVSKALETLNNKPAPLDLALDRFAQEVPYQ